MDLIPEIARLAQVPQNQKYHYPYVLEHVKEAVAYFWTLAKGEFSWLGEKLEREGLVEITHLAWWLHDIGKWEATYVLMPDGEKIPWQEATPGQYEKGKIKASRHEVPSSRIAREVCQRLGLEEGSIKKIENLVYHHMTVSTIYQDHLEKDVDIVQAAEQARQPLEAIGILGEIAVWGIADMMVRPPQDMALVRKTAHTLLDK